MILVLKYVSFTLEKSDKNFALKHQKYGKITKNVKSTYRYSFCDTQSFVDTCAKIRMTKIQNQKNQYQKQDSCFKTHKKNA